MCVTFVVFTDCESCTRPISTNPGSMEAGECGRTRGTCFIARRLDVVAVAGLLWILWCVLGAAGFFRVTLFRFFFFFERTRPAASMRPPLASFTSLLVPGMHFCFCAQHFLSRIISALLTGFHGSPHGGSWHCHGLLWYIMALPWESVTFHGLSWAFKAMPRIFMAAPIAMARP